MMATNLVEVPSCVYGPMFITVVYGVVFVMLSSGGMATYIVF